MRDVSASVKEVLPHTSDASTVPVRVAISLVFLLSETRFAGKQLQQSFEHLSLLLLGWGRSLERLLLLAQLLE